MVDEYLKEIRTKADSEKFIGLFKNKDFISLINNMSENDRIFLCREIRKKAKLVDELKFWNEFEKNNIKKSKESKIESYSYFFEEENKSYDTGNWMLSEYGVIKRINGIEMYAAYQLIIVTKRYINIEDDIEKFELTYYDDGKWKRKNIPRAMLSSANSVSKLVNYGISIAPSNANNFCNYINDFYNLNMDKIPTIKSISRLGWVDDNFDKFLPYTDSNIMCDSEGEYKKIIDNFTSRGEYEIWLNEIEKARKNINVRLYTDASFASPLIKILGINGFLVHLYGDRGKGKTVSLMTAMSIWGNPQLGKLTNSINNTMFALECRAEFLQNLPFSGDELQNIDTKEINNDALIYMVSNGSGKGRGDKDRTLKRQSSWNLIMMTTGEIPITNDTSRSGCKVRCIEIENNNEMYEGIDLMEFAENIKSNYGFAGKKFIEYVIKLGRKYIFDKFEAIKKDIMKLADSKLDAKQLNSVSVLKLADDLARECIFTEEEISNEKILSLVKEEEEINIALRAWNFVISEIMRERYYFDDEKDSEDVKKDKRTRRNKTNGKINFEKKEVYINFNCLKEYLEKGNYKFNMVKEKWANDNMIATYNTNKKYYVSHPEYGTVVKLLNFVDGEDKNVEDILENPPF